MTKLGKKKKKKTLEMGHGGFTLNPLNPKSMVCTFGTSHAIKRSL
jgi:hypothetical protein